MTSHHRRSPQRVTTAEPPLCASPRQFEIADSRFQSYKRRQGQGVGRMGESPMVLRQFEIADFRFERSKKIGETPMLLRQFEIADSRFQSYKGRQGQGVGRMGETPMLLR
jgi:hypothetical protein